MGGRVVEISDLLGDRSRPEPSGVVAAPATAATAATATAAEALLRLLREVLELRVFLDEGHLHAAGGAVAVLADDQLRHRAPLRDGDVRVEEVLAVNEDDEIGVLLDG